MFGRRCARALSALHHRVEPKCFLLTSIVQLLTECIFWTRAAATFGGSFICAKNLLIEATWRPSHMGPMPTSSTFKAVARRLTAMPEVLPVQFMQMLCSNGVKLSLDLTVADECDGQHKQCCANDPQSEEPTSPIHCSNDAITIHANLHQFAG